MMPMRGALTLGATAQDLVEALVMQLTEKKACDLRSRPLFVSDGTQL